jgi:ankyrin repeat protein
MALERLPVELVLQIIGHLDQQALSSLTRTSRNLHSLLNHELFRRDLALDRPSCIRWASFSGNIDALRRALTFGAEVNVYCEDFDEDASLHILNDEPGHYERQGLEDEDRYLFYSPLGTPRPYGTPLHLAAMEGHEEIVTALLDAGAVPDAPSRGLCSCLPLFGTSQDYRREDLDINSSNDEDFWFPRWSALHLALCGGHTAVSELLVSRGASLVVEDPPLLPWESTSRPAQINLVTALHTAAGAGDVLAVNFLLDSIRQEREAGRNTVDINMPDENGCTALHYSACGFEDHKCHGVITALSFAGIMDEDNSALNMACGYLNFTAATLISDLGPKVTENDEQSVPATIFQHCLQVGETYKAPDKCHLELRLNFIKSLVRDHSLRLDGLIGYYGVVTATAQRGHPDILRTILELGAPVEHSFRHHPDAQQAAHAGVGFKHFHITMLNIQPLVIAVREGNFAKSKLLLDYGADPNSSLHPHLLYRIWSVWHGDAADDPGTIWPLLLWRGARLDDNVYLGQVAVHWGDRAVAVWREWRRWFHPQHKATDDELRNCDMKFTELRFDEVVIGCAAVAKVAGHGGIGLCYYKNNIRTLRTMVRHARPESGVTREVVERAIEYCRDKQYVDVMMEVMKLDLKLKLGVTGPGTGPGAGLGVTTDLGVTTG